MSGPERTGAPEDATRITRAPEDLQTSEGAVALAAGFAGAAQAAGIGVALPRLDRRARAGAALALQRSAGNAAVGRMLRGPRRLSRSTSVYDGALQNVFAYPDADFDGRYEGIVDGGAGMITLRMRVKWELEPQFANKTTGDFDADTLAAYARMRARFKEVVERIWSGAHRLKPAAPFAGPPEGFAVRTQVVQDSAAPHAVLHLFPQTPGGRSCATAASIGTPGIAAFQEGDDVEKEHTLEYKGQKMLFYGNTCAHEFGHLLGLKHVNEGAPNRKLADGQWTDVDKYGVNPAQAMDIMGMGNVVSAGDMAPFIRIAERYGKDHAPEQRFNRWTVVEGG